MQILDDIRLAAVHSDRAAFARARPWPLLVLRQQIVGDLHYTDPNALHGDPHEGSTLIHVPRVSAAERVRRPPDGARVSLDPERWVPLQPGGDTPSLVIGRGLEAAIQLPDFSVSDAHACIHLVPTTVQAWVEDLDARNPTVHNGVQLVPEQRSELRTGDELIIGHNVLLFLDPPDFHRYLRGEL